MQRGIRSLRPALGFLAFWTALAPAAGAVPLVSIDADPGTPGIQSIRDVVAGTTVTVDIVVSGVDPGQPLQAFELDLAYDASRISATGATAGDFLVPPIFVGRDQLGASSVGLTLASLGADGASGGGVLAHVQFLATAEGSAFLTLQNVQLSAPFGEAIPGTSLAGAALNVVPVPEPGSMALLGLGLVSLSMARREVA